jgi:DNA modification methylase
VRADLVYVDPPYASQADYVREARLDGRADGRTRRSHAFGDKWRKGEGGIGSYLEELGPRLEALARLLVHTGTLWVHLDWRAAYLVRVLLDEILGRDAFKNEIVWRRAPNLGRQAASGQFGRTLDTILVYGGPKAVLRPPTRLEPIDPKSVRTDDEGRPFTTAPRGDYTDLSIAKLEKEGRVHRTASGKVYIKYFLVKDDEGTWCRERRVDALWTDVAPLRHAKTTERTGYPTQKPRALLDRIVRCGSPEGGLVVDLYAGSGTTGEAAHACGRRFVLGDGGASALATSRARLLRAGAALSIELVGDARPPSGVARASVEGGHVRLATPKEPLAWATGTVDKGVFCTLWHGERRWGATTEPAPHQAPVPAAGTEGSFRVRAYEDDGTVTETTLGPTRAVSVKVP